MSIPLPSPDQPWISALPVLRPVPVPILPLHGTQQCSPALGSGQTLESFQLDLGGSGGL
jgi:hypothetical protein